MSLVVGLDIGSKTVTGAVFSGKPKAFRLVDFFVEDIPSITDAVVDGESDLDDGLMGTPLSLEEFLADLIKRRKLEQAEVVSGFDTKDCVVREFPVPFTKDEQIAKTVLFEAENYFPGIDLEDYTLEYMKIGEVGEKSQLLVWALQNERIGERLRMLQSLKVDPVGLDIDAAALFNGFTMTPTFDREKTTLIVDMGKSATKILVVENGRIRKVRALRLQSSVMSPDRLIPAAVGAGAGAEEGEVALLDLGQEEDSVSREAMSLFENDSIETRFREIEEALARLDPEEDGADPASDDDMDSPIAILSDDDYDLVREEGGETPDGTTLLSGASKPLSTDEIDLGARQSLNDEPQQESSAGGDGAYETPLASRGEPVEFDYDGYLERIALEIQRTVAGMRLSSPVELLCLTGGMSQNDRARRYFSEEFDIETIDLDFEDAFPSDLAPEDQDKLGAVGAVAVGLGVKHLGVDEVGVEFRKGQFRFEHKLEKIRFPALIAAVLFFLYSLQAVYWGIQDWKRFDRRIDGYGTRSVEAYKKFFGASPRGEPYAAARKQKAAWEGKGVGRGAVYLDAVEALASVSGILKGTRSWFEIKSMKLYFRANLPRAKGKKSTATPKAPSKATIIIRTDDPKMRVKLEPAFRKSPIFSVTISERGRGRGRDEDIFELTLNLTVKDSKLKELK